MRAMVQATQMRTNATAERRNWSGAAVATRGEVVGGGEAGGCPRARGRRARWQRSLRSLTWYSTVVAQQLCDSPTLRIGHVLATTNA